MKNESKKRVILTVFLSLYILAIYVSLAIIGFAKTDRQLHLNLFYIFQVIMNQSLSKFYLYNILAQLITMIPVGFLFPLARQQKCFSQTMLAGCVIGVVFEFTKFILKKPIVCFDAIILTVVGVLIGYKLFTLYCSKSANYIHLLYAFENGNNKFWIISLISTFLLFTILNFTLNGGINILPKLSGDFEKVYNESQKQDASSVEKGIYVIINRALAERKSCISFVNHAANQDDLEQQFAKVLADHPEYFWLSGNGKYETITVNNYSYFKFYPDMLGNDIEINSKQNLLDYNIEQIIKEANRKDSDYEKAKYVHDTLILNCVYDDEACEAIMQEASSEEIGYASSAYGCIVNHRAVCSGYARAYQLVMNKLGIECGFVTGSAPDLSGTELGHAWNYIKLDGEYYFVDITWDDHICFDGSMRNICYDYFCITTAELLRDHIIDEGQNIPFCEGQKY